MTKKVDEARYVKYTWAKGDVVVEEPSPAKAWLDMARLRTKAVLSAQCADCVNFEGPSRSGYRCRAFPDGIPRALLEGRADHEMPYPGDHGVRFEEEDDGSTYD